MSIATGSIAGGDFRARGGFVDNSKQPNLR
jgi:hypothetical protein